MGCRRFCTWTSRLTLVREIIDALQSGERRTLRGCGWART